MFEKEYALLRLFEAAGHIKGRKRLQKTVHLLQVTGVPFGMGYEYREYGPYSFDLQLYVNTLSAYGLIDVRSDGDTYIYGITEIGKEFMTNCRELVNGEFDLPLESVTRLISTSTKLLEISSTYCYLIEMGYNPESAREKTSKLKPHLKNNITEAIDLYDSLLKQKTCMRIGI